MLTKIRHHSFSLMLLALLLLGNFTQASSGQDGPKIETWHTSNGAKVLFVASTELPIVDLRIAFDAGAAKDGHQPGLALLSNGLMTEGTGDLGPSDIAKHFENLGARFSNSSHRDMAIVSLRSLSDQELLQPAVDMLAQLIAKPSFPLESYERERKRLLISIQSQKESIGSVASKAFYKAIYGDHPYSHPPTGTEASVNKISLDDIKKFHRHYYVANNASIAIMGDLNLEQAKQLAEQLIGLLPKGAPAALPTPPAPRDKGEVLRINHPSQQTHILMGQPGMTRTDTDFFPLYLGNHILGGGGLVSRLSEEIREKRGLSYSAYSSFTPMRVNGPFTLGLQTRNDQADEAADVLRQTLVDYIKTGPSDDELKAAKQNITGSFPLRLASNNSIVEYLSLIGFYDLPLDYLDTFNDNIEAVSKEDIIDAFQRRVSPDTMVTVIVGGEQQG